ncbi:hypothetical protein QUA00_18720, partial [Microcoleus sp. T2B6]|uniref:hypothetical protein n=1 Tax=Microcoleus sp. T2B6 TaxID=3055424 RepID=UPI002FD2DBE7
VVEIGAGEGLEFTTEEAEAFRQKLIEMAQNAEDGELTEEQLESAAGGTLQSISIKSFQAKPIVCSGPIKLNPQNIMTLSGW